jgi:hypothetical protein
MKKAIDLSRSTQLLIAANAVLALIVSAELLLPAQPGTANAAAAGGGNVTLPDFGDTTIAAPPISQLVDMTQRPLFYIDRRMPEPEAEEAPPPLATGSYSLPKANRTTAGSSNRSVRLRRPSVATANSAPNYHSIRPAKAGVGSTRLRDLSFRTVRTIRPASSVPPPVR